MSKAGSRGRGLSQSKSIDMHFVIKQFTVAVWSLFFSGVADCNYALNAVIYRYTQNFLDVAW